MDRGALENMLRPAGGGIHTVSTGAEDQRALQRALYDAEDRQTVSKAWWNDLDRIADAEVVVLGVPSDVGAGFARGANFGPQALRLELIRRSSMVISDPRIVDAGDVRVVPQLLHDDMLSDAQRAATRTAMYGGPDVPLPVTPLSIAEKALGLIREINPRVKPLLLGGDHSVGWPGLAAVARGRESQTGILHFDAHTDLLEERLGIKYCFATWAYHANELVGRNRRLAQVGLRISSKTKEHWETTCDLRQYWAEETRRRSAEDIASEIIESFEAAGVTGVYISNDIDGTDPEHAGATGTPEPGGLEPDLVVELMERVAARFEIWGSDLVEVAPTLNSDRPDEPQRTLQTAARYIEAQAKLMLPE